MRDLCRLPFPLSRIGQRRTISRLLPVLLAAVLLSLAAPTKASVSASGGTPITSKQIPLKVIASGPIATFKAPALSPKIMNYPVFDAITNVVGFSAVAPTRTFMGQPFDAANPGTPLVINQLDIVLYSATAQNYSSGLALNIQFWDTFDGTATPIFSTPVSSVQTFTFFPFTTQAGFGYLITVNWNVPVSISGFSNLGVTFNWQGDTGSGLTTTDNLTTAVRGGPGAPPIAVGDVPLAPPNLGYYRNASGRVDFNFNASDGRNIGANSALAIRLFSDAPLQTFTPTPIVNTATATITPSVTDTATPTLTPSVTDTASPTFTASSTLPASPTTTASPTDTATSTLTSTITATATTTLTPSVTDTPTTTLTPSVTLTNTAGPSPTATSTATDTPTVGPSPTTTVTPSATTVVNNQADTIGVYSQGTFYLRNSNTTGIADIVVSFGNSGMLPVTGEWNGDGVDTVGVFDPFTGVFYLRDSNSPGTPDYQFVLGNPGDTPLHGRWDASMAHDGAGVFRPSNSLIYLKRALITGFADYTIILGNPGDAGIAGDWDGNGLDSIGVFRPSNVTYYLSNTVTNGIVFGDYAFVFGVATGKPFAGDWTASGVSRVGFTLNGQAYLHTTVTNAPADIIFTYGPSGALPVAGRWAAGLRPPPAGIIVQPGTVPNTAAPKPSLTPAASDGKGSYD